jgi:2-polyprenyl-3-methyl-5-hydroxy-6-metoxy-1,4-benzoquinol methylase
MAGPGRNLRDVVRQELVARQLQTHLPAVPRVLDIGCAQGTQALRLARQGHQVTGLDASAELLAACKENSPRSHQQPTSACGSSTAAHRTLPDLFERGRATAAHRDPPKLSRPACKIQ